MVVISIIFSWCLQNVEWGVYERMKGHFLFLGLPPFISLFYVYWYPVLHLSWVASITFCDLDLFFMRLIIRPGLGGMSAGSAAAPVSASGGWRIGPNQPRPPAFPSSGENPSVGLKPPLSPQTDSPGDVGGHQLPHQNSSHNHRERAMMTRTSTDLAVVRTRWHSVFCEGQFQLSLSSICS